MNDVLKNNLSADPFLEALSLPVGAHLKSGARWLLAVSGGADSVALLAGLVRLREEVGIDCLHVGHLNHGLRGEAGDADAAFVAELSEKWGVAATVERADIAVEAQSTSQSLETAGRVARYRFLARTAAANNCNVIATAHTADDQAETILHRIIRGTGLRGLAGIPAVRELDEPGVGAFTLVRPLLEIRREVIETFLRQQNIPWREDASNRDPAFTRNRLRRELLPLLRQQYNPQVDEVLRQLGRIAGWADELLQADANGLAAKCIVDHSSANVALDATALRKLHRLQQAQVIAEAMRRLGVPQRAIGFEHIGSVLQLLQAGSGAHSLPTGWMARMAGDSLFIEKPDAAIAAVALPEVVLSMPGMTEIPKGYVYASANGASSHALSQIEITMSPCDNPSIQRNDSGRHEETIDADRIVGMLRLRTRIEGEQFYPLGAPGGKKLGDFLTDAKTPLEVRDRLALVCDDEGIVWACGLRIAERVKVTPHTKRLICLTCR